MKKIILGIFFVSSVHADCNIKLAKSAAEYINNLEKAKLTSYQNNSVCEVLSYEWWRCTDKQQKVLEANLDIKEVLGNYCMPHLPVPSGEQFGNDEWMKGADVYSWKVENGYTWFALLPGTNRVRTTSELVQNKVSEGYLRAKLKTLPKDIVLSWNNLVTVSDKEKLQFVKVDPKTLK